MTTMRIKERNRNSIAIEGHISESKSIFGNTWYVDGSNGNNTNTGKDPLDAFATLAQAASDSAAGDTIVIAPGTYSHDVSAGALTPKADQIWKAAIPSYGGAPSVIIVADADDGVTTVAIDVDNVTWIDIEFRLVAGGTTALVILGVSQTTAVRGGAYINCWFNLNSVDAASVFAVALNDATNATTGVVFKGCVFIGGDATTAQTLYIEIGVGGAPNCIFEDCILILESADGDAVGFNFLDPGTSAKSYGVAIRGCDFIGPSDGGGDAVGIVFHTNMTEDEIVGMVRGNFFSNCTTAITIDKINNSVINNYEGDNATGGTLVDPGT